VFDCDGVLFESRRANVAYYDAIRAALGLPPMDAAWQRRAHYLAASQVLATMFADDPGRLARADVVARDLDYGPFYDLMDPAPGLHDVLATLRRDFRLGMATNRSRRVRVIVERFGLAPYLEAAVGCLDVERPKPAPDLLLVAVARLGVPPAAAVYVGDAETDLAAARAAGLAFLAIGEAPWSADAVPALRDVPAWLARRAPDGARGRDGSR